MIELYERSVLGGRAEINTGMQCKRDCSAKQVCCSPTELNVYCNFNKAKKKAG